MGILDALLRNESGGRNVANVDQGTSSGQAQGYFQITTGTWNDFGGQKYAPNPLAASYDQQADIASRIPLKRWDKSTIAAMQATGRPIDPDRTLGENLAANGESFVGGASGGSSPGSPAGTATASVSPMSPRDRGDPMIALEEALAMRDSLAAEETRKPKSLLAETLASGVTRDTQSSGTGGVVADATDQESAMVPLQNLAPSAVPETPPAPVMTDAAPAAKPQGLADLFTVKDIGVTTEIDPITGLPRPYRSRRAYG